VLNALCGGRFARTARLPGRTRAINLFALQRGQILADLPGYGYAVVAKEEQRTWSSKLMYFIKAPCLCGLVLVVDCRRGLQERDMALLHAASRLPALVLMNKADKLGRAALRDCVESAKSTLATLPMASTVLTFSALKKRGLEKLRYGVTDLFLGEATPSTDENNAN
jgi:GTP-binding protein